MRRITRARRRLSTWGGRCDRLVRKVESQEPPGVIAGGRLYPFTDHFVARRTEPAHARATDTRIEQIMENPDFSEPRQGDRQVFWKYFPEQEWWIKVVLLHESHAAVILSAYEDTFRGQRRWQASQLK